MNLQNDLVYILGKESCWQNNELRYSLRSVEKFLKNYGRVWVFGEDPGFLNKDHITHVPCKSEDLDKAKNIKNKLLRVCGCGAVSDNFMFFNDDYFLMGEVDATNYPYYWKCDLQHTVNINRTIYKDYVWATIHALNLKGLPLKNFDTHKPIIYNKQDLFNIIHEYDWSISRGYIMRSIYCNTMKIEGVERLDNKFVTPLSVNRWKEKTAGLDCFSIADRVVNRHFKQFLEESFPEKSLFEK